MRKKNRFIANIGQLFANQGIHLDANELPFLERELTQLRARIFDVQYPALLGRGFVDMADDIAPSAGTYSYKVYDHTGTAKVSASAADDAPRVSVSAKEVTGKVYDLTMAYGWGLMEMRESARVGGNLDQREALAARDAIENGIDLMLYQGRTNSPGETNLVTTGLVNNADITVHTGDFTSWVGGGSPTDGDVIYGELSLTVNKIIEESKQRFAATHIAMPLNRFNIINTTRMGVDSDTTVLKSFLTNHPYIKEIKPWFRLDTAGVNGTGRVIAYQKDKMVLEGVVPMEFEQLPPQARNFEFVVNCIARSGGVKVYMPPACRYRDFPA